MKTTRHIEYRWTVSRGRYTYGYNICTLYVDGRKVSRCNGGGYDMEGTCLGSFIAREYADRLLAMKPDDMPAQSHWERAENPRRICRNMDCLLAHDDPYTMAETCPHCGKETEIDWHDGKCVDDGRYFYGLSFIDPSYDPGKAVPTQSPVFGNDSDVGKTVEQLEAEGKSLGLERYQQFWRATKYHPSERHTVPSIDGACGKSSVEAIAKAIGLTFEYVPVRSKKQTVYVMHDAKGSAD